MNLIKKNNFILLSFLSIVFVLTVCCISFVLPQQAKAETIDGSNGLDFINNCPTSETVYQAGSGTVTFIPATQNEIARIVFDNATLNAELEGKFRNDPSGKTYFALAYNHDAEIILNGENYVYLNKQYTSSGILFYDSNLTISGEGSLFVGFAETPTSYSAHPFNIMGNYDVLNGLEEGNFKDGGNLTINGGNIEVDSNKIRSSACLYAHNDIIVNSGIINLKNNTTSIYSNYANIVLNGGVVTYQDFSSNGLYARYGDVTINGNDTVLTVNGASDREYAMGIIAGNSSHREVDEAGSVYINGGDIDINVGYIGIFAQKLDAKPESGNIKITNGRVNITTNLNTKMLVGMYIEESETAQAGNIEITGGEVVVNTNGSPTDYSIGLYSVGDIIVNGGKVEVYATTTTDAQNVIAFYAENNIDFINGNILAKSKVYAVSVAPTISDKLEVIASTNENGESPVTYDETVFDTYKYLNIKQVSHIENVTIEESDLNVEKGASIQLNANVIGDATANKNIVWSISGAKSENTKIDSNGLLTISNDETATEITVTATSSQDATKFASVVIKISEPTTSNALLIALIVIAGLIIISVVVFIVSTIIRKKQVNDITKSAY